MSNNKIVSNVGSSSFFSGIYGNEEMIKFLESDEEGHAAQSLRIPPSSSHADQVAKSIFRRYLGDGLDISNKPTEINQVGNENQDLKWD